MGLVVEAGPFDVEVDFLQANDIRVFVSDDINDSLEAIASVAATNSFVNVVAEEPQLVMVSV